MIGNRELLLAELEKLSDLNVPSVTVSQLAKSVGLTRSSLYKYYPDIIIKLRTIQCTVVAVVKNQDALKIQLLKNKIKDQKSIIDTLATICSNQLIEFSELKASSLDKLEALQLKISFLESQIAKLVKPGLKVVK